MIKKIIKCILGGILLSGLMVGSVTAAPQDFPESDQKGKVTIHSFDADEYDNLKGSTGTNSNWNKVSYSIQRLDDSSGTAVSVKTPVDGSFQKQTGAVNTNGQVVFSELPKGYYLITPTAAAGYTIQTPAFVVMLPMRSVNWSGNASYNYDVHVYPKSASGSVIKKEPVSVPVVGVGDKVLWDISYPVESGIKKVTSNGTIYATDFYITDTMDSRLDYVAGSAKFKIFDGAGNLLNVAITKDVHYREEYDAATRTVTWRYTDLGVRTMADNNAALSIVRITTLVNASALGTVEVVWNNASIHFVNTSGDPYRMEVFPAASDKNGEQVPKVYLGTITIDKHEKNQDDVKLADVTFKVASSEKNAKNGNYIQAKGRDYQVTTDVEGSARFTALGAGTYWLVETRAADGYKKLDSPVKVTIGKTAAKASVVISIANTKESGKAGKSTDAGAAAGEDAGKSGGESNGKNRRFPFVKTGDMTNLFYPIVSALLAAVIFLLVWKRRQKHSNESERT